MRHNVVLHETEYSRLILGRQAQGVLLAFVLRHNVANCVAGTLGVFIGTDLKGDEWDLMFRFVRFFRVSLPSVGTARLQGNNDLAVVEADVAIELVVGLAIGSFQNAEGNVDLNTRSIRRLVTAAATEEGLENGVRLTRLSTLPHGGNVWFRQNLTHSEATLENDESWVLRCLLKDLCSEFI